MYEEMMEQLRNNADHYMTVEGAAGLVHLLTDAADAIDELDTLLDGVSADNEALCETIEMLKKQVFDMSSLIGDYSEKTRWVPVTERLPREELCFYLCYTDGGVIVECLWTNNKYGLGPFGEWGWRLMDVPQYQRITHWMSLPSAPEPPNEGVGT